MTERNGPVCWVGDADQHIVEGEFLGLSMDGVDPRAVVRFKGLNVSLFKLGAVSFSDPRASGE